MRLERFGVTESHHRSSGDRIAITAYLGKGDAFDQAFPVSSAAYADQNERITTRPQLR
jgi:hypothetical protein